MLTASIPILVSPAKLTLIGAMVPLGRNMEANTVFQSIDRTAKIVAPPAIAGVMALVGASGALLVVAVGQLIALLLIALGLTHDPRGNASGRTPRLVPLAGSARLGGASSSRSFVHIAKTPPLARGARLAFSAL